MDENKGRLALERHLQKAFKAVQSFRKSLQCSLSESLLIVETIASLLDQFECCAAVDFSTLPVGEKCPDLKVRLTSKIEEEIAERVEELKNQIEVLKEKQEVTSKHCEAAWNLVQKYFSSLQFVSVCASSHTSFSLADMIEWLETIDSLLHQQYWSKAHLLELMTGEEVTSDNLVAMWTDEDDVLMKTVTDYLARVELFVSEKR